MTENEDNAHVSDLDNVLVALRLDAKLGANALTDAQRAAIEKLAKGDIKPSSKAPRTIICSRSKTQQSRRWRSWRRSALRSGSGCARVCPEKSRALRSTG
jgi:hypothetical protein